MTEQMAIETRLPNETLENAISVYRTAVEVVEKNECEDYNPVLDKVTIRFLEELQQYRAIGTVEELNKYLVAKTKLEELSGHKVDVTKLIHHFCETIFEGEKHEGFCILTNEDAKEWEQLKALGTIAELQALKEKSVAKKVRGISVSDVGRVGNCPTCGKFIPKIHYPNSCDCGQHLDWE